MATRFYLPSGTPYGASVQVSAGWNDYTGASAHVAVTTKTDTPLANGTAQAKNVATNPMNRFDRIHVSDKLAAQTISGTFSMVIRAAQSNNALNAMVQVKVLVLSEDALTVKATLFGGSTNGSIGLISTQTQRDAENAELTTSTTAANAARRKNALALTSYDCIDGDRLAFETGYRAFSAGGSTVLNYTGTLRYGDPTGTADMALSSTAADECPWIELSQTLAFYPEPSAAPTNQFFHVIAAG